MREIKFRAWCEDTEMFGYVCLNSGSSIHVPKIDVWKRGSYSSDHITFMNLGPWEQYTGLKDKNGKEIYEGDILRFMDRAWNTAGMGDKLALTKVKWYERRACFLIPTIDEYTEVVGNIHENGELLEVES